MFSEVLRYVTEETGKTDSTSWLVDAALKVRLGFVSQSPLNDVCWILMWLLFEPSEIDYVLCPNFNCSYSDFSAKLCSL